jgi:hypothetical protein
MRLQPLDEVARHPLLQRRTANHERHRRRVLGKVQRRLPGRIRATDDEDVAATMEGGLADCRAIVDPAPDQLLHPRRVEPPVVHARRTDRRPRPDPGTVDERDADLPVRLSARLHHVRAHHDLGPEAKRLRVNRLSQLCSAHALREAREVLDPRARPGLPSRCMALDDNGIEPFRGRIDGGRQPRRTGPDDQKVVLLLARARMQPDPLS